MVTNQSSAAFCGTDAQEYKQECLVHSVVADWFSRLLIAPLDYNLICECQSEANHVFLEELGQALDARHYAKLIAEYFLNYSAGELERFLGQQYISLFDGVAGPYTVPLYESFYKSENGRLCQEPYADMLKIMNTLDVKVSQSCKEPADHLALELASLAESFRQRNNELILNLRKRLSSWVPGLSSAVKKKADTSFYALLLDLLVIYLSTLDITVSDGNLSTKY